MFFKHLLTHPIPPSQIEAWIFRLTEWIFGEHEPAAMLHPPRLSIVDLTELWKAHFCAT